MIRLRLSPRWLQLARPWAWALVDRIAFLVESALVANGVFWTITWMILHFSWKTTVREWGSFWTHYARASLPARQPVEIAFLLIAVTFTLVAAFIRFPKARLAWAPWPSRLRSQAAPHIPKQELAA
jgi:hypothetical protein